MQRARETLSKEIDIIEIVKTTRYVLQALDHLLPSKLQKELQISTQFTQIGSSTDVTIINATEKVGVRRNPDNLIAESNDLVVESNPYNTIITSSISIDQPLDQTMKYAEHQLNDSR